MSTDDEYHRPAIGFYLEMSPATRPNLQLWKVLPALMALGTVAGLLGWFVVRYVRDKVSSYRQEQTQKRQEAAHLESVRRAIQSFTASTSAVNDWNAQLCKQGNSTAVFTSDLQRVLMRSDPRPILLAGELKDIKQSDGLYVLIFSSYPCLGLELRLELVGDSEQTGELMAHRSESVPFYAIAIRATSVQKDEQVSPDSAADGHMFVVRGVCSKALFTGLDGRILELDQRLQK